jgi:NAD(P)-dependent dehydrogenase (short-subunit alcohol dehydrogenase family)
VDRIDAPLLQGGFFLSGREGAEGATRHQAGTDPREWRIAAGRFGDCDDVGAMVAMFCSEFANYITGQSLVIDGGATTSTF